MISQFKAMILNGSYCFQVSLLWEKNPWKQGNILVLTSGEPDVTICPKARSLNLNHNVTRCAC